MSRKPTGLLALAVLGVFLVSCGSGFSFFFVSNPGAFDDVREKGGVIISVRDQSEADSIESVSVVEGALPMGMDLLPDGTLRGIPEEDGTFFFTAEWLFHDGHIERQPIELEIPAGTAVP